MYTFILYIHVAFRLWIHFSGLFGSGEAEDEEKIGEDNFDSIEMGDHFSPLDAIEQGTDPYTCTLYVHCTHMYMHDICVHCVL